MEYKKPPRDSSFLSDLLKERTLQVSQQQVLITSLERIGYFRLRGYMYPFQLSDGSKKFKEGTDFKLILDHYHFDKKLRLLLLDVCEQIETSIKSKMGNTMALKYGAHWYLDAAHFHKPDIHDGLIKEVEEYCNDCDEQFIKDYNFQYTSPKLPAIWMVMETLTFGQMSRMFENLKEKKEICAHYNVVDNVLVSWLKSINFVRNCCAHHARLWNRGITLKPLLPTRKGKQFLSVINFETNQKLYGTLSCILFLLKTINPESSFKTQFAALLDEYPEVNVSYMGFPANWKEEEIWM